MAQSICIKYELVSVTPTMAQLWLDHNCGNRKLSNAVVTKIKNSILAGKWQVTHQGIAIDETGNLIDGQHRCNAIIQASKTVKCWVATYSGATTAREKPIDIGNKRSVSCVTGLDAPICELLGFFGRIIGTTKRYQGSDIVENYWNLCSPQQKELLQILSMKKLPAPIRAGFFLFCSLNPKEQIKALDIFDKVSAKGSNKYYGLTLKESSIMNIIDSSDYSTGRIEAFFKTYASLKTDNIRIRLTNQMREEIRDLVKSMFCRTEKPSN